MYQMYTIQSEAKLFRMHYYVLAFYGGNPSLRQIMSFSLTCSSLHDQELANYQSLSRLGRMIFQLPLT